MLELDELFHRFLKTGYTALHDDEKLLFEDLLIEADPDLYRWLLVGDECPAEYQRLIGVITNSSDEP